MLKPLLALLILIESVIFIYPTFQAVASNDKIDIKSDKLTINRKENVSIFENNVVLRFKDMLLKTKKIKVVYLDSTTKDNKLDKIIISDPFVIINHKSNEKIEADYAEYKHSIKQLIIKGKVRLIKDNKTILCNELIFYTDINKIPN